MLQRWSAKNGRPPPASGRDSSEQVYFDLDCGCSTKIQIKTACRNLDTAFQCSVHKSERGRGISAPQRAALQAVQQLPGVGSTSVEQFRVLHLAQKPIDIVLEQYGILVEVDGSQHGAGRVAWCEQAGAQFERDRQLDRGVLSSGGRLVRLHWQDEASWHKTVQAAIQRVQQQPNSSFIYYSPSYPEWCRVQGAGM